MQDKKYIIICILEMWIIFQSLKLVPYLPIQKYNTFIFFHPNCPLFLDREAWCFNVIFY